MNIYHVCIPKYVFDSLKKYENFSKYPSVDKDGDVWIRPHIYLTNHLNEDEIAFFASRDASEEERKIFLKYYKLNKL